MTTDKKQLREAPININGTEFRKIGYELVDQIASLLDDLPNRSVSTTKNPQEIKDAINFSDPLPSRGEDAANLMKETTELLINNSLYNGHPNFYGYITSSPAPIGILSDMLAAAINPNVGAWQLAPSATAIESQTVRWIAELIGYPSDTGGLLVSGGNMANFVGFISARFAKSKHDIRKDGIASSNKQFKVYVSKETHTWVQKATDICGLGTDSIRWIECDCQQRINVDATRSAIEKDIQAGHIPMMVVGTAGNVSTGAVDNLPALAALCREHDVWFHVDGAYGAFATLSDTVDPNIHGISKADSVALDPHKWLYAPLEAGCALVRDRDILRKAFSYHPPYYHFDEETINYFEHGPQNSRGFRALKVWMGIKQAGRTGYEKMINDDIKLAKIMYDEFARHDEFEELTHNLSITTFRYLPHDLKADKNNEKTDKYLSELNEALLVKLKESGEVFVSNAIINDQFALRACIVNFRTSEENVRALPDIIAKYGRLVDKEMRSTLK